MAKKKDCVCTVSTPGVYLNQVPIQTKVIFDNTCIVAQTNLQSCFSDDPYSRVPRT